MDMLQAHRHTQPLMQQPSRLPLAQQHPFRQMEARQLLICLLQVAPRMYAPLSLKQQTSQRVLAQAIRETAQVK